MTQSELQILISAKDEASGVFSKMQGSLKGLGTSMAVVGTAIVAGLGLTVKAAMEAEAQIASMDATLNSVGDSGRAVRESLLLASQAVTKLGFDDEDAAVSLARLFQRTNDLAEATKLNTIAMDLARAKHMDLAQASNLVGMVLSGNSKILKQFGIDLKDSSTPMEALNELQKKVAGQAEAYSKTFAGATEVLKQQFQNLQETIGAKLLPVLTRLLNQLMPLIERTMDWIDKNPKLTETIIMVAAVLGPLLIILPALVAGITALLSPVGLVIIGLGLLVTAGVLLYQHWDVVKGKLIAFLDFFDSNWRLHWEMVKLIFKTVWETCAAIFDFFVNKVGPELDQFLTVATEKVRAFFEPFVNAWNSVWDEVQIIVTVALTNIDNAISNAYDWIINKVNSLLSAISSVASAAASLVGISVPSIPKIGTATMGGTSVPYQGFATGGIVTRPTFAMVGEAGPEAIIPLSHGGLGPIVNISIGNFWGGDPERAAREIGDLIIKRLQLNARISS